MHILINNMQITSINKDSLFKRIYYIPQIANILNLKIGDVLGVDYNIDVHIWDEAFSNLDDESQKKIINEFSYSLRDKMVICIIHNKSLLKYFDKIILIENSKLEVINNEKS